MKDLAAVKQDLQPLLQAFESTRKRFLLVKSISQISMVLMVTIAFAVGGLFLFYAPQIERWIIRNPGGTQMYSFVMYGLFFIILLCTPLYFSLQRLQQQQMAILQKIVQAVLPPNFRYQLGNGIRAADLLYSRLFTFFKNSVQQQVYNKNAIVGELDGVGVRFGDVAIFDQRGLWWYRIPYLNMLFMVGGYVESIFKKSAGMDYSRFKGLFIVADFPKTITGHTVVLPDRLEKRFSFIAQTIQKLNFTRADLVQLENPNFEKEFVVYSDDQVQARYALSPSLMEHILEWQNKIDRPIMLSFVDNKLYIAIVDPDGVFDLGFSQNVLKTDVVGKMYTDLQYCFDLVQDLRLNVKIWGK